MNRTDLQILAEIRVADAEALIEAGRWAAAYYLVGYAVECGLKACAARRIREHDVPEESFINDFYTHRFEELLLISGYTSVFLQRKKQDPRFRENWEKLGDWKETLRYNPAVTESAARRLVEAVSDPLYGVLPWLKTLW